jgi:hypothetical protein
MHPSGMRMEEQATEGGCMSIPAEIKHNDSFNQREQVAIQLPCHTATIPLMECTSRSLYNASR